VGDEFRASVIDARVRNAEVRFAAPFTEEELARFRHAVEHPVRDLERVGIDLEELPKRLGTRLFQAVFSEGVLTAWRDALGRASGAQKRLSLRLHLRDAALEAWPWESLRDPGEDLSLALSPRTPIVRYPADPLPIRPLRFKLPMRILGVVPHPLNSPPLEGEREWQRLHHALAGLIEEGLVSLDRLDPPTLPALRQALSGGKHQILHFIGHGSFDSKRGQGLLLFEDDMARPRAVGAEELGTLLHEKRMRLVVLNSCYGARGSSTDPFAAVAANLIHRDVAAVIAMQFAISDEFAVAFAPLLYERLASGDPIDLALTETRLDMRSRGFQVEWRNPVLYMRSSRGRIFTPEKADAEKEQKVMPPTEPEAPQEGVSAHPFVSRQGEIPGSSRWRWKIAAATLGTIAVIAIPLLWQPRPPEPSPECPSPPGLDMKFRLIQRGSTLAGARGLVAVDGPYCIGMYELTRAQQAKILGASPIEGAEGDLPAAGISRQGADEIVERLHKLDPSAHCRLPTGDQWEYAARGGSREIFHFGANLGLLPKYGNCTGLYESGAKAVGSYRPNKFGLYDMYGNVSEWVSDVKPGKDGEGQKWFRRGGGWRTTPKNCNSVSELQSVSRTSARDDFGLRIVRDPVFPTKQKGAAVKPPPSTPR
jgi:hypothetical protein